EIFLVIQSLDCLFCDDAANSEIHTLSLHDALPIFEVMKLLDVAAHGQKRTVRLAACPPAVTPCNERDRAGHHPQRKWSRAGTRRSEEHTSELQSLAYLVCRLLLEKKKQRTLP